MTCIKSLSCVQHFPYQKYHEVILSLYTPFSINDDTILYLYQYQSPCSTCVYTVTMCFICVFLLTRAIISHHLKK